MEPIKTIGQKLRGNELRDAIHIAITARWRASRSWSW